MSFASAGPRETSVEAGGYAKGVATAIVRQNSDPDGMGRVRVSFPWHVQSNQSYWARIAVPMAGNGRGVYFLPEVGDEVIVAFERGDLRFPCVIGAVWNGKDKPPESNSDGNNDVRTIKSRKGHLLSFNDGDQGLVTLQLNDGKLITIDDNGIRIDDQAGNSLTIGTQSGEVTLSAAGKLTLKGSSVSVESQGTLDMTANATLTINGALVNIN